jgi:hypothetical protein
VYLQSLQDTVACLAHSWKQRQSHQALAHILRVPKLSRRARETQPGRRVVQRDIVNRRCPPMIIAILRSCADAADRRVVPDAMPYC